jgi:hypothetical protein
MNSETKRSFYILLCGIIGVFFFLLIERGLLLLAFLIGVDVNSETVQVVDSLLSAVATFFGLWYGIWLGLHWYRMVYEEGAIDTRRTTVPKIFAGSARDESVASWGMDDLAAATRPVHSSKIHIRSRAASADSVGKRGTTSRISRKSNSI